MAAAGLKSNLLNDGEDDDQGRITPLLIFSCLIAASGGLLFGYEHGVSGGVTSMDSFLEKFFPYIYAEMKEADGRSSNYCKFDSQRLTFFISSLYIAGLFSSLLASHTTTKCGRRFSMRLGGAFFFAGAAVGGSALNLHMLILSRLLLGFGIGFTSQAATLYLSEIAPARYRGAVFTVYDICITSAILLSNLVNYVSHKIEGGWGWRLSLSLAALPAAFLATGAVFIPETPTSIIQRGGDPLEVSTLLQRIRGTTNIGKEVKEIIGSTSAGVPCSPLRNIFKRKYRPQLVTVVSLQIFQQLAGVNLVGVYAPVMFRTIGLKESASLLSALVMRLTATASNLVAVALVDNLGRRMFFVLGGVQLLASLMAAGVIMALQLGDRGAMSTGYAHLMLVVFCSFVSGFAWSWGPLPTLVASEVFPVEVRSAGRSISVAAGFLLTSVITQSMLSMLCFLKWGIFFFFGVWMLLMTLSVLLFLPETKGLTLEQMERVWREHWYWKRFAH